ncbi:undecaprenyl-diphosphatase [Quadrisphaera granulorum]|uniref:Undecaprenyl-diphosphatase n=1 Tax=Quadrisphaera granulorum TaxID=317664 RepID=A0A316ADH1_9ACTN|nr:phosphatase PAP2 family protein [Quadrisphaera granulorum]PWJ55805.1 undecaprenyl-diphosphatase [Quadrisphaera granulorum]SZE95302.1 undecaprenyl-diphosphatase [Quadrisphaera granulorum]
MNLSTDAPLHRRWSVRRLLLVAAAVLVAAVVAIGADVLHQGLLSRLDAPAKELGERLRSPDLTPAVRLLSDLGTTPYRAVLAAALVVPLAVRWRTWRPVVYGVLVVGLAPAVSASTKRLVDRPRPPAADALEAPLDPSFPSGHATASAALATGMALLAVCAVRSAWARIAVVAAAGVFALVVGLTRVYIGAHWITDVLAGWCTGAAVALVLAAAVRPWVRPGADSVNSS